MANLTKDTKIKQEFERLINIFKDIGEDRKKLCTKLIQNAAFMSVTMDELQVSINKNGVVEKYQNGENQSGVKKSSEVDIYNNFIKQYTVIIRQLNDLLQKGENVDPDDGFNRLLKQ